MHEQQIARQRKASPLREALIVSKVAWGIGGRGQSVSASLHFRSMVHLLFNGSGAGGCLCNAQHYHDALLHLCDTCLHFTAAARKLPASFRHMFLTLLPCLRLRVHINASHVAVAKTDTCRNRNKFEWPEFQAESAEVDEGIV